MLQWDAERDLNEESQTKGEAEELHLNDDQEGGF
jgi:hypothetical protein